MKILNWLKISNRWKHFVGGAAIGAFSGSDYCALYASVLSATSLEYKDKAHGCEWDWIDFGLTIAGAVVGRLAVRWL